MEIHVGGENRDLELRTHKRPMCRNTTDITSDRAAGCARFGCDSAVGIVHTAHAWQL